MNANCQMAGTISHLVFQNEENGYTVLRMLTTDGELVTVVGMIPFAAPGESLIVCGHWVNHPVHGEQLQAEQVERQLPTDAEEIFNYLSSGIVKGMGPSTADKIVRHFGEEALLILEEEPERLTEIRGITAKKARELGENYRYQTGMRRLLEFLDVNDLPLSLALRLYRRYGAQAMDMVRANPYLLVDEPYGVDFSIADEIAITMGIAGNHHRRLEAALLFELSYNLNNGHVFLPRSKLLDAAATLLHEDAALLEPLLVELCSRGAIRCEMVGKVEACYLRRLWEAECSTAEKLEQMLRFTPDRVDGGVEKLLERIQREQGITYAPAQRQAVELAAREGILLLTGGPGTGKTTSVRGIVALLERMGLSIQLLAPTGRAAKRLGELCGREAQTIHRALGMVLQEDNGETVFQRNAKNPLEAEAVVVDEMSMVDLPLMAALLAALRPDCRLVMVGDPDQLPSVGAGNVFGDLIRSGRIPTVSLSEVFRQAQTSAIIRTAHEVNHGNLPELKNQTGSDFFFMRRRDPPSAVELVVELCGRRLPEKMGIPPEQIQVLCPTRKGEWGTIALNRALQATLNPPSPRKKQVAWGDLLFREGDRVMQIRNNYDVIWERDDGIAGTGIFNGDVGIVEEIDAGGHLMTLRFDDRLAVYVADLWNELELAYAVTVHKAQGSEYRAVVLIALPAAPALMVRGVLYTGITRARELLVVVGDDLVLSRMTQNDKQQRRYSGLRWRLKQGAATLPQ